MTQFFNRKDKCSLMWRMVGCGFLPASKTDPWNVCGNQPGEHWLDHIGKRISSATAIIVESVTDFLPIYTAAQKTAIFVAKTNRTSTFVLFVLRLNLKKSTFPENLCFCAIILHHELWSLPIMILSFCIWSHANMNTTYIPGYHLTDISYISLY